MYTLLSLFLSMWAKFGTENLQINLFNNFEFREIRYSESHYSPKGVKHFCRNILLFHLILKKKFLKGDVHKHLYSGLKFNKNLPCATQILLRGLQNFYPSF
jgi:hypothetical protein